MFKLSAKEVELLTVDCFASLAMTVVCIFATIYWLSANFILALFALGQ